MVMLERTSFGNPNYQAPASIGREDLDLTGTYPTSIGEESPFNPIESPIFSSRSTPIFVERFPDTRKDSSSWLARMALNNLSSMVPSVSGTQNLRIFVATWNVGGKSPRVDLNLNNLLPTDDQSDIYVLGFQEIIPLNAGNVLVIEGSEPAVKWLGLINKALNAPSKTEGYVSKLDPLSCTNNSHQTSGAKSVYRNSKTSSIAYIETQRRPACFSCPQPYSSTNDSSEDEEEEPSSTMTDIPSANNQLRYCLVTSKQMVGIFVTVWVKREHAQHIGHLRLSTIGRGILGYLGNKLKIDREAGRVFRG